MSIEIQCMTEKLIVITIKLDYSKVPSKSTVPTYDAVLSKKIINIISSKFLYFENFFQDYFFIFFIKFLGMHGEYAPDCERFASDVIIISE